MAVTAKVRAWKHSDRESKKRARFHEYEPTPGQPPMWLVDYGQGSYLVLFLTGKPAIAGQVR